MEQQLVPGEGHREFGRIREVSGSSGDELQVQAQGVVGVSPAHHTEHFREGSESPGDEPQAQAWGIFDVSLVHHTAHFCELVWVMEMVSMAQLETDRNVQTEYTTSCTASIEQPEELLKQEET